MDDEREERGREEEAGKNQCLQDFPTTAYPAAHSEAIRGSPEIKLYWEGPCECLWGHVIPLWRILPGRIQDGVPDPSYFI